MGAQDGHLKMHNTTHHTVIHKLLLKLNFGAPLASRLLEISGARVCISPAPQSPSPKLETTRSLFSKKHRGEFAGLRNVEINSCQIILTQN